MRLALYARVSSERQEREQTIESQKDALLAYAAELGAQVVTDDGAGGASVWADDGVSGGSLDRPAMTRLRDAIRERRVDAVAAYDLDRISRDRADLFTVVKEVSQSGAALLLAKSRQRFEDTDEGVVLSSTFAMVAELERRRIGERARRGLERRARVEGRHNGGIAPFGFVLAPCSCGAAASREHQTDCAVGTLVIHPEEADWCRQMSRWLLEDGLTPGIIGQRLMERRVPTKYDSLGIVRTGSKRPPFAWYPDQVRKVLTDPLYSGEWSFRPAGKEPIVTPIPAVFDGATMEAHRVRIARNRSLRTRADGPVNILRGLVTCGDCGRRYVAGVTGAKNGGQRIYRCGVWHHPRALRNCTNKGWTAKRLEGIVWGAVEELIRDPENVLDELRRRGAGDRPELRIGHLEGRLARLDEEDDRVREGFRVGIYNVEQTQAELARSTQARAILSRELVDLRARRTADEGADRRAQTLRDALAVLRRRLPRLTHDDRATVLQQVVTGVTVRGEDVEIDLILAAPTNRNRPGDPR